jgi:hypothetical protein
MSIFGPYYPSGLQQVVNHAERFASLLHQHETRTPPSDESGRTWVTGRAEELEIVVGFVIADWQNGELTEGAATSAIASYLRAVHARAERHLRIGLVPKCCVAEMAPTEPATPYDNVTVRAFATATAASATAAATGDTLIDPASMVPDEEKPDGR